MQSTAAPVSGGLPRRQAVRSQQKISNRPLRVATRALDGATHEPVTVLVGTGHHALPAFGTKRPWVQIPPPRQKTAGQRPCIDDLVIKSSAVQLESTAAATRPHR